MLAAKNRHSANRPVSVADDDDSGVPLSERGKGEAMPMDKRHPSWVLAIIGLTFVGLLAAAALVIMTYLNITSPTP